MTDIIWQQHDNDVHVNCDPKECNLAGKVARFHSHDYDGPIVCCDED
jgi:hypothetical protein